MGKEIKVTKFKDFSISEIRSFPKGCIKGLEGNLKLKYHKKIEKKEGPHKWSPLLNQTHEEVSISYDIKGIWKHFRFVSYPTIEGICVEEAAHESKQEIKHKLGVLKKPRLDKKISDFLKQNLPPYYLKLIPKEKQKYLSSYERH